MSGAEAPAPPKAAPESLALRGRPVDAIRFRRNLIIAIAAAGALALVLIAWLAFRPSLPGRIDADMARMPEARPDASLEALPVDYAQVPQLGPPLPGDLGRPILAQQRAQSRHEESDEDGAAFQAAERQAAAAAPLLVPRSPAMPVAAAEVAAYENQPRTDAPVRGTAPPAGTYRLVAGTIVRASLITGIRSDLPGLVTAQVTSPVFDSESGMVMLVPQGARLIGDYETVAGFGQRRLGVLWRRLIYPDGSAVDIDGARATDAAGNAGLEDKVDLHTGMLLKGAAIATLLGIGAELSLGDDGALAGALRRGTQDSMARAGDRLVQRNLDIKPTITVRPGAPVSLLVGDDLFLRAWRPK